MPGGAPAEVVEPRRDPDQVSNNNWCCDRVYAVKHVDVHHENCAIARSAVVVLERRVWAILCQAFNGAQWFEDFQRRIGVARNVPAVLAVSRRSVAS
jgi:hypothetical protein